MDWDYFSKFSNITDAYLPVKGEGETKASQIVTAVTKLVYKFYNDGDVFDNRYNLRGWMNDLSSYANWLAQNYPFANEILTKIEICECEHDYENLLKQLANECFKEEFLVHENSITKSGSIYKTEGKFKFKEDEFY